MASTIYEGEQKGFGLTFWDCQMLERISTALEAGLRAANWQLGLASFHTLPACGLDHHSSTAMDEPIAQLLLARLGEVEARLAAAERQLEVQGEQLSDQALELAMLRRACHVADEACHDDGAGDIDGARRGAVDDEEWERAAARASVPVTVMTTSDDELDGVERQRDHRPMVGAKARRKSRHSDAMQKLKLHHATPQAALKRQASLSARADNRSASWPTPSLPASTGAPGFDSARRRLAAIKVMQTSDDEEAAPAGEHDNAACAADGQQPAMALKRRSSLSKLGL